MEALAYVRSPCGSFHVKSFNGPHLFGTDAPKLYEKYLIKFGNFAKIVQFNYNAQIY